MPLMVLMFCLISTIAESAQPPIELPQEGQPRSKVSAQPKSPKRSRLNGIIGLSVVTALGIAAYKLLGSAASTPSPNPPSKALLPAQEIIPQNVASVLLNELTDAKYAPGDGGDIFRTSEPINTALTDIFKQYEIKHPKKDEDLVMTICYTLKIVRFLAGKHLSGALSTNDIKTYLDPAYCGVFRSLFQYDAGEHEIIAQKCSQVIEIYKNAQKLADFQLPSLSRESLRKSFIYNEIMDNYLPNEDAQNECIIKFICSYPISAEEIKALSQIKLSPVTPSTPDQQQLLEIPNPFFKRLDAWTYLAKLPEDNYVRSVIGLTNQATYQYTDDDTRQVSAILLQCLDDSPDWGAIAQSYGKIEYWASDHNLKKYGECLDAFIEKVHPGSVKKFGQLVQKVHGWWT